MQEDRKLTAFMCSAAVYSEILKDNVLREKMSSPSRLRIHLPRAKVNISSPTVFSISKKGSVLRAKRFFLMVSFFSL